MLHLRRQRHSRRHHCPVAPRPQHPHPCCGPSPYLQQQLHPLDRGDGGLGDGSHHHTREAILSEGQGRIGHGERRWEARWSGVRGGTAAADEMAALYRGGSGHVGRYAPPRPAHPLWLQEGDRAGLATSGGARTANAQHGSVAWAAHAGPCGPPWAPLHHLSVVVKAAQHCCGSDLTERTLLLSPWVTPTPTPLLILSPAHRMHRESQASGHCMYSLSPAVMRC